MTPQCDPDNPPTLTEMAQRDVDLCEDCGGTLDSDARVTRDGVWLCEECYADLCAQWDAWEDDDA